MWIWQASYFQRWQSWDTKYKSNCKILRTEAQWKISETIWWCKKNKKFLEKRWNGDVGYSFQYLQLGFSSFFVKFILEFRLWKFRSRWNHKSNIIIIAIDFDQSNDGRKGFKLKWSTDPSSSRPDFTNWSAADASKYTQGNDYNFENLNLSFDLTTNKIKITSKDVILQNMLQLEIPKSHQLVNKINGYFES